MRETRCLLFLNALSVALLLSCGGGPVVWDRIIDTGGDEIAAGLATDGTTLVVLGTVTQGGSGQPYWLLQTMSLDGQLRWHRDYREGTTNVAGDVVVGAHGGIFVAGTSEIQGRKMCVVVKYRHDGVLSWQRALAVGDDTRAHGIVLTGDGILVCGSATDGDEQDAFVALLDLDGETVWTRSYDFGPVDEAVRIATDSKGGIVLTGRAGTAENPDILLAKLNGKGDTLWTRIYDSGGTDHCGGVTFDVFGNVLATGTAFADDSARCVILEYHPDGTLIRRAAYTEQARAEGRAIQATPDGDILVAGCLHGPEPTALLAFHYQPNASSVWERTYRREAGAATGADLVIDGDAFVLGTIRQESDGSDMVVVRFSRPLPAGGI